MISKTTDLLNDVHGRKIGIGRGTDRGAVESSSKIYGDLVTVYDDPELMIDDLVSGKIDAAVRGDMSSDKILPILKKKLGLDVIERAALIEPQYGNLLVLAPVGIDEGLDDDERAQVARKSADLARKIGMCDRIAVLSGGRSSDRGRSADVDKTMESATNIVKTLSDGGYDAYDAQILIEDAADEAGIILALDGMNGNLIFRTLHFLGGARAVGAPVLNSEKIFIDTSRAKTDYSDSIALAMRLAGGME